VSIRTQELPHWNFLFHCRLLFSSAILRVTITSVRSQPCFSEVQKGGNAVPTPLHPRKSSPARSRLHNSESLEGQIDQHKFSPGRKSLFRCTVIWKKFWNDN